MLVGAVEADLGDVVGDRDLDPVGSVAHRGPQIRTAWRSMIAAGVDARRQRPEDVAPVALEPGRAEGVGDGRVAVTDEQRSLEGQGHPLDQAAGAGLDSLRVGELGLEAGDGARQPRLGLGAGADLVERAARARPALRERAQRVEGLDVAGALPDRLQRRLPEQPRHPRLLGVAVAAEALERLDRVLGGALAGPVLEHRRRDPADQRRALVAGVGLVELAGEPEARDRRRLRLDREVGEDVRHQRLVDQPLAERGPVLGVPDRLRGPGPHARRRAERAVEPGVADHLDDRRDPAALLADHHAPRRRGARSRSRRSSGCRACP